ncbi:MAG: DUF423 domain-containing protein [Gammaproteobacteria bacterium]|nr:DUF423 domain-containing protein [Gammaproteobacteria bacterium]
MARTTDGFDPLARRCIVLGAALMLAGVILGAFGTHLLEARLTPRQFASYQTGVLYQLLHSLGLILLGVVAQTAGATSRLQWSARMMLVGIACFSGSIYLMTAGAPKWLGMVAPVGGLSFMLAWLVLALDAVRRPAGGPR